MVEARERILGSRSCQDDAAVAAGQSEGGIESQGAVTVCQRLVQPAANMQCGRPAGMGFREVRSKGQRAIIARQGLVRPAQRHQGAAASDEGLGQARVEGQGAILARDGLGVAAAALHHHGETMMGLDEVG